MNKKEENKISGQLWMRTSSGKLIPSKDALSAIYIKYSTINPTFYNELINNQIKKFDCFYDVLYVQTNSGYLFDEFIYENNNINLINDDNRFTITNNDKNYPDYWFDELNKKIYVVTNKIVSWNAKNVVINIELQQFDITSNFFSSKLSYDLEITICSYSIQYNQIPILEDPKISYNKDTRCFNISFIMRGPNNEFGLISNILKKNKNLEIETINCLLPYCQLESIEGNVIYNKSLETDTFN